MGEEFESENSKSEEYATAEMKQLLHVVCTMQSESSIWCMDAAERFADNIHTTRTKIVKNNCLFLVIFIST